jgi:hypothetical protein
MADKISFFWWAIALAIVALAGTIYGFRRRWFERGFKKGEAADPDQVRRENPKDDYARR